MDNFDLKKFLKESKALENLNPSIKAINEGSGDYDSNVTLLKKYFSIDEKLVDDWCDLQGYAKDDLARESLKQYLPNPAE